MAALKRGARALEHREELVSPRFHDLAGERHRSLPKQRSHTADQLAVLLTQPFDEARGVLDVGHQHGEEAGRQRDRFERPTFAEGALRVQLAGDEPEGHDPVLLRGVEQPGARPVARDVVLEADLVEPSERVSNVGRVMDRKPSPAASVNVGERTIREIASRSAPAVIRRKQNTGRNLITRWQCRQRRRPRCWVISPA